MCYHQSCFSYLFFYSSYYEKSLAPNRKSQNKKGVWLPATFIFSRRKNKRHTYIIANKRAVLNNVKIIVLNNAYTINNQLFSSCPCTTEKYIYFLARSE